MKIRDISLMATGAAVTVAVIVVATTILYTPKAQAQAAASAPGAIPMIVTVPTGNYGLITVNDPIGRKVTVVSYNFGNSGVPTCSLSSPSSFSY
jgi:hypothetical protein